MKTAQSEKKPSALKLTECVDSDQIWIRIRWGDKIKEQRGNV